MNVYIAFTVVSQKQALALQNKPHTMYRSYGSMLAQQYFLTTVKCHMDIVDAIKVCKMWIDSKPGDTIAES